MGIISGKEKIYCYDNLFLLCQKNGISEEELRIKLDMSRLQFGAIGWPKASKKVADYFGLSVDEFMYEDLSVPSKIRGDKGTEWKTVFCKKYIQNIIDGKDVFFSPEKELISELYSVDVYKQIAFQMNDTDYSFVIIINTTDDRQPEPDFKFFPQGAYAYGYIRFDEKYVRYFKSFEDATFKKLCDSILEQKEITDDKWQMKDAYKREHSYSFSLDVSGMVEDMMVEKISEIKSEIIFGMDNAVDDLKKIGVINKLLELLQCSESGTGDINELLSDETMSEYIQSFLQYKKIAKKSNFEMIEILENILDSLNIKINEQERENQRIKEELFFKNLIISEIVDDRNKLGAWNKEDNDKFCKYINSLTIDEFCEQLTKIAFLDKEDLNQELPKMTDDQFEVMKIFLWAKRVYCYTNFIEPDREYDVPGLTGCFKKNELIYLLAYIQKMRRNETIKYYGGITTTYAVICILLFGQDESCVNVIQNLYMMHIEAGINNQTLDELYNDMCIWHGVTDGKSDLLYKKEFKKDDILALSGAQWTAFFEETDDKIIENAIDYVYEAVADLFRKNEMDIADFFRGRNIKKKYKLFRNQYNDKLDKFAEIIPYIEKSKTVIRNNQSFIYTTNGIYEEGCFDTIELLDTNHLNYSYPLVDKYLATYICKYMEGYLRNLTKYKTKVHYKYGGYYCFDTFFNDPLVPKKIVSDYKKLKYLLETNELRDAIYDGMDTYFTANSDEYNIWKNYLKKC